MKNIIRILSAEKNKVILVSFVSGFLLALHYALIVYINSSFVGTVVSNTLIGILYTIGAFLALVAFILTPHLLAKIGNLRFMRTISILEILALGSMAFGSAPWIIGGFLLHLTTAMLLPYSLDIFLEGSMARETHTGGIRGMFLTLGNFAFVLAPVLAGFIIGSAETFSRVYIISLLLVLVTILFSYKSLKGFKEPIYKRPDFFAGLRLLFRHKNMERIFSTNLVLQSFYVVMAIYTPLYLHEYMGFSWVLIGEMISIALIPFILFQVPSGLLADKRGSEKGLLILGLCIMGGSTLVLPFLPAYPALWIIFLFLTRVGASLTEIMNETYFFRHINGKDAELISLFRTGNPLSYIVIPVMVSLILLVAPLKAVFIFIGLLVLLGIIPARKLVD